MQLALEAGQPHDVLLRKPPLPSVLRRYFDTFFELDVSEHGRPLFTSMLAALDELGVVDRLERQEVRRWWWSMYQEQAAIEREKRAAAKKQSTEREQERAKPRRGRVAG